MSKWFWLPLSIVWAPVVIIALICCGTYECFMCKGSTSNDSMVCDSCTLGAAAL